MYYFVADSYHVAFRCPISLLPQLQAFKSEPRPGNGHACSFHVQQLCLALFRSMILRANKTTKLIDYWYRYVQNVVIDRWMASKSSRYSVIFHHDYR
jgi:hypothetical protein